MSNEDTVEYRNHKLVARFYQGAFKGRAYGPAGKKLIEIDGDGIDVIISTLRDHVDATIDKRAKSRTSPPQVQEYVRAFQHMIQDLPDSYLAMLKAHYHAPGRTMTATQLSKAGGYKNWSSANLHYGLLGKRLYDELPIPLPKYPDGKRLIYTFALATEGDLSKDESQWQWTMRPEVASAIKLLGITN